MKTLDENSYIQIMDEIRPLGWKLKNELIFKK